MVIAPLCRSLQLLSHLAGPTLEAGDRARVEALEIGLSRKDGCAAVRAQLGREDAHARAQFTSAAERCTVPQP